MIKITRCVDWIDPLGPSYLPVHQRVTEDVAIQVAKEYARARGIDSIPDYKALDDFIVTNWGTRTTIIEVAHGPRLTVEDSDTNVESAFPLST